jgi:hypothetical protein
MIDAIDKAESALTGEIAQISAKRERLLERSRRDVKQVLALNSKIALMGIEIDEAKEAILSEDPARSSGRFSCSAAMTTINENKARPRVVEATIRASRPSRWRDLPDLLHPIGSARRQLGVCLV